MFRLKCNLNIIGMKMNYYIGYKMTHSASKVFVYPFRNYEEAKSHHNRLKKELLPGEIITPPFISVTDEKAVEEAKKLLPK